MKIQVLTNADSVAQAAAKFIATEARASVAARGRSYGVVAISFDTGLVAGFIIASRCYIAFRGKDGPSDPRVLV